MVHRKCHSNKLVCCYESPSPWLEWGLLYWLFSEGSIFLGSVFLVWLNIWKIFKFKATVKAHICNQNLTASTIFYWTIDPFLTRLCLMVYHSKLESCEKIGVLCICYLVCWRSRLQWKFKTLLNVCQSCLFCAIDLFVLPDQVQTKYTN